MLLDMEGAPLDEAFTPRQEEVLEAALGLLVEGGERAIENAHAWLAEERRGDTSVAELSVAQTLGTGMRTSVARCWVDGSTTATGGARTVIAKCFHSKAMSHNSGGLGIVREIAGLRSLANAPLCYAADQDLGVVVMEDVPGTSLGTILAGNDPSAALAAAARQAFGGLPHRLQTVRTTGRIRWIDDTLATTGESVVAKKSKTM